MNGMPLQYLNGTDDNKANDLVGLLGLDGSAADDQKIYDHLIETRKNLIANPSLVKSIQNPANMLDMLDYAIKYWNTPKREMALDVLEKEEERLVKAGAILTGVDDNNQPLQGFFSKIKDVAKKAVRVVGDRTKAAIITAIPASAKAFEVGKALLNKKSSPSASTQTTPQQPSESTNTSTTSNTQNKMPDTMENPNPGFVAKYLTPKNLIIGGVIIGGVILGYSMMKKKNTPKAITSGSSPLSGVRKKRKTAKRRLSPAKPKTRKVRTRKVRTVKVR